MRRRVEWWTPLRHAGALTGKWFHRKLIWLQSKQIQKARTMSLWDNPIGTDGFEFVEYTAPDVTQLRHLFERMGFRAVARHRSKDVTLFRQGGVNFVVNAEPDSHGSRFAKAHGPSACAMAFRVKDAALAYRKLMQLGAKPFHNQVGPMELNIPAIEGIGGSVIYLVDRYGEHSIYDVDFLPTDAARGLEHAGAGLSEIDHVTHNVFRGNMDQWAGFYEKLFNFREIRYFDIEGKLTGLKSRAMTSPDGKIRIPINESSDDKSQIAEYLDLYKGEGIQHIALGTDDIYSSVETLRKSGVDFQDTPDTYYERLDNRIKGHGEDVPRLMRDRILMDGAADDTGLLLQIFTQNAIGPIFFELIQRKGNQGFGEGNFKALFESIEADQIKRGVLKDPGTERA
jgi:4-hydroxyphenylpyruvate dioxygenase